jgi:hypothetical protein
VIGPPKANQHLPGPIAAVRRTSPSGRQARAAPALTARIARPAILLGAFEKLVRSPRFPAALVRLPAAVTGLSHRGQVDLLLRSPAFLLRSPCHPAWVA